MHPTLRFLTAALSLVIAAQSWHLVAAQTTAKKPVTKTEPAKTPPGKPAPGKTTAKTPPAKTPPAKTEPAKTAATKAAAKGKGAAVSFVRDVAPVLNTRCGGCHVRNARGQFSMSTYANLMKGPPDGKVIVGGNLAGSDLIVKVEEKQMPPSGAGIPAAELETLKKWVQEGARFDGPDMTAQLTSYIPGGNQPAKAAATTVQQATGKETVSFAIDIAPVLLTNCIGCHGTQNPRNMFSVNTVTALMKGGDRGEPILPGKAEDSLIIKKLKGTAEGARMPQGRPALDAKTLAKFEKWIEEGAKFDGPDPSQPLLEVAAIVKAQRATHEELSADRVKLAQENWQLGMPGTTPIKIESTNFCVLGNIGQTALTEVAKKAEALAPKIAELFKAPKDQPLVKGRITLFVFGERYDYGEFGKMVEKRDLPSAWRGHFRYSIIDGYGAVLAPRGNDYSLDALIGQQIAAVYIASQGRGVPRWFAEGCGRIMATRLTNASDGRISQWDDDLHEALGSMAKPDDFLKGKLQAEQSDICSFSYVKFLMSDNKRFFQLVEGLRKGAAFNRVFQEAYGGTPEQLAAKWAQAGIKGVTNKKVGKK